MHELRWDADRHEAAGPARGPRRSGCSDVGENRASGEQDRVDGEEDRRARGRNQVIEGSGRTCRPASGSTTTSWLAARPSATRGTSTGTLRLTMAERDRSELVVPGTGPDEADDLLAVARGRCHARAAGCRSRPGAASSGAAAAGRACAPGPRSPGRGSSPCRGVRRCRSSPLRWGSCGGRCPGRAGARRGRCAAPRRPTCPHAGTGRGGVRLELRPAGRARSRSTATPASTATCPRTGAR